MASFKETGLIEMSLFQKRSPQLVWSGPEASGLAGDTSDVYEALFAAAKRSLWVASFVYDYDSDVFSELAENIDTTPGLEVRLLLNINRRRREKDRKHRNKKVVRRFADTFWRQWPGEHRPLVYYDRRSVDLRARGKLHAKAVVADEERVFVTSPNLTFAAWDHNVELGLLVRDRALAKGILTHFQRLIDLDYLRQLPE